MAKTLMDVKRSKLDVKLERITWSIWEYTRENRHSLNSDVACRMIRSLLDGAVSQVQEMLNQECTGHSKTKTENNHLKAKLAKHEKAGKEVEEGP